MKSHFSIQSQYSPHPISPYSLHPAFPKTLPIQLHIHASQKIPIFSPIPFRCPVQFHTNSYKYFISYNTPSFSWVTLPIQTFPGALSLTTHSCTPCAPFTYTTSFPAHNYSLCLCTACTQVPITLTNITDHLLLYCTADTSLQANSQHLPTDIPCTVSNLPAFHAHFILCNTQQLHKHHTT